MALAFFTVPVRDSAGASAELNAFLRNARVLALPRQVLPLGVPELVLAGLAV